MSDLRIHERVASLEVSTEHIEKKVDEHSQHLKALDKAVLSLVTEVKQIRNALYLIGAALIGNMPALENLIEKFLK